MERLVTGRPPTRCVNGVVASPHYLASMAGARVLADGGNAVDAAVATNAALTVVYPHMCALGGDAFWLIQVDGEQQPRGLNGSGRAPAVARLEWFQERGIAEMPHRGMLPVTVPGAVDSWATALEAHGTRSLDQVLAPAIQYASEGFPVSAKLAAAIEHATELLEQNPAAASVYLPSGRPPRTGELLVQSDLGRSLELLARQGRDALYRGSLGSAIAATSRRLGGLLDEADLARHRSDWVDPIRTTYRGTTIFELPPPTQGILALEMLKLAEGYDLNLLGPASAGLTHLLVEAKKLAYLDRDRYLTDPDFAEIPTERLLSSEYAAAQRERVDPARAQSHAPAAAYPQGDTIALCTADRWGNAVTLIQSIYMGFGSGVMADGTGIMLQNRGAYFSLQPSHPNRIAPNKRTFHTLIPGMAFRDGRPWLVFGTMGADGQPQTHVQVLTNMIDFGMNVQEAIEAPRWLSGRFVLGDPPDVLNLEARFADAVLADLEARGHQVRRLEAWAEVMGHAQAIEVDPSSGVLAGGADPRGDGAAIGW